MTLVPFRHVTVLDDYLEGKEALQYTVTEGHQPLREKIAERYKDDGMDVSPENILITNGSMQGLVVNQRRERM